MPEQSAGEQQQSADVIEIRPHRGSWQCYEAPGVGPYWIGDGAKESVISYAKARANFRRGEIRLLNADGAIERVIAFDGSDRRL